MAGRSVVVLREHVAPDPEPDLSVAASVAAQEARDEQPAAPQAAGADG